MREKLTSSFCFKTSKTGYHADGGGLYLIVKSDSRKYWCFRWRDRHSRYTEGKSAGVAKLREKGLGRFGKHDISLEKARKLAGECRNLVRKDMDPISEAHWKSRHAVNTPVTTLTFAECLGRYIEEHKAGWRNEKQASQWLSSLNTHATALMQVPVSVIDSSLVLSCIEPIWSSKTETATRVRQRIKSVLDWAADKGHADGENPARWHGNLDRLLPMPTRLKRVKQSAFLDYEQMPPFMKELQGVSSSAARALELQILTASRPGDVVAARWQEFGLKGRIWTIPASRTTAAVEHTVPLSPQVMDMLKKLPQNSDLVFPGRSPVKPMTTAAGMKLLRTLRPGLTQLGFRTTFQEWAKNEGGYANETIEYAINPQQREKANAASLRSDLIAKRAQMMRDWADFCCS